MPSSHAYAASSCRLFVFPRRLRLDTISTWTAVLNILGFIQSNEPKTFVIEIEKNLFCEFDEVLPKVA